MEQKKINVAIIFGGKSAEHEVSLQSAKNVFEAIDKDKYNPILIGIDKSGRWLLNSGSEFLLNADNPQLIKLNTASDTIALAPQNDGLISNLSGGKNNERIDVAFPILHGPFGEDGTVQGLLKLAGIPFVGAGVLGSAVGMDKDVMKRLLRDAGLPIGRFISLRIEDRMPAYAEVAEKLGQPFFIKPANMGSSVGINKIHNEDEYLAAVREAFDFDVKIILEEYIAGRELECSVLGNHRPIASVVGEVVPCREFYSYEAKYIDEHGAMLEIPANIPTEISELVRALAVKTFQILSCEGLARVDFFLKPDGEIIINEINTIPGFTKISMYPKLWEASGVSYADLIDRLIRLAIERFAKEQNLKTDYMVGAKNIQSGSIVSEKLMETKKVTKLIIPVAGLGTRLLPATKAVPKEMLPVLNKPVLQYIVEEAVKAGIKDIILVTSSGKEAIEDHFDRNEYLEESCLKAGKETAYQAIKEAGELANFIFIRQNGPYGTGTPVLNCKHLIGDEPFAVVWGDDIVEGPPGQSHLRQLMDVYEKYQQPVITAVPTDDEGTKKFGIIDGIDLGDGVYEVKSLVEKPGPIAAKSRLGSISGYILTPDIFEILETMPAISGRERYLTDAIDLLIKKRPLYAKVLDAIQHDTGNKFGWLKTNIEYGLKDPEIGSQLQDWLKSRIKFN